MFRSQVSSLRSKVSGFTFVETVLTIVIIGVIASVAAKVLLVGLDIYSLIVNRNTAFHNARAAMDRMQDEMLLLRNIDFISIGSTNFGFRDVDGALTSFKKSTVTSHGKSVPCIMRGTDYLAGDVTQLAFRYYMLDGSQVSFWPLFVRRINIDFTVTALNNAGSIHLISNVFPRNFMYSNFQ